MSVKKEIHGLPSKVWKKLVLMKRIASDPGLPKPARLIPGLIAAYLLSPIDLVPDFIPVLGQMDDLIVVGLLLWLFFRMTPKDLTARHQAAIDAEPETGYDLENLLNKFSLKRKNGHKAK